MYGRNGSDQLNMALLIGYLVLALLGGFLVGLTKSAAVDLLVSLAQTGLAVWILFRCFSKNLAKRRAENARFLQRIQPLRVRLSRATDKSYRYFPCPGCKTVCRVPRGKGTLRITCPKCGNVMQKKT